MFCITLYGLSHETSDLEESDFDVKYEETEALHFHGALFIWMDRL